MGGFFPLSIKQNVVVAPFHVVVPILVFFDLVWYFLAGAQDFSVKTQFRLAE